MKQQLIPSSVNDQNIQKQSIINFFKNILQTEKLPKIINIEFPYEEATEIFSQLLSYFKVFDAYKMTTRGKFDRNFVYANPKIWSALDKLNKTVITEEDIYKYNHEYVPIYELKKENAKLLEQINDLNNRITSLEETVQQLQELLESKVRFDIQLPQTNLDNASIQPNKKQKIGEQTK